MVCHIRWFCTLSVVLYFATLYSPATKAGIVNTRIRSLPDAELVSSRFERTRYIFFDVLTNTFHGVLVGICQRQIVGNGCAIRL